MPTGPPTIRTVRYYPGQPQFGPFLTLGYMAAPLQNANFGNPFFFHVRKGPNIGSEPNFHDHTTSNG